MSNGDCVVGAKNATEISNLQKGHEVQGAAIRRVEDKIDRINWWLVALLGGMVVSLVLQFGTILGRKI